MARSAVQVLSNVLRYACHYRATITVIATPLLASILLLTATSQEAKCAYVVIVMVMYWVTEAIPLAVTALLPMVFFPALGVSSAKEFAADYLQEPLFLLIGGLAVALAIEESRLHERIALHVLLLTGSQRRWILLGIMYTTAFLSIWINSTATTATMLPVVEALLLEMTEITTADESQRKISMEIISAIALSGAETEQLLHKRQLSRSDHQFCKIMLLSVCYSANTGAVATITSTASNILAVGMIEGTYGKSPGVTYARWMAIGVPTAFLNVLFAWVWLQVHFSGWKTILGREDARKEGLGDWTASVRRKLHALGGISWRECTTAALFLLLILLWLFREAGSIGGWSLLFKPGYVTDSSAVMLIMVLFFVVPREKPHLLCWKSQDSTSPSKMKKALLDWPTVETRLPWGVILLAGGSLAMAGAIERSGLSKVFGDHLAGLGFLRPSVSCLFILLLGAYSTEVCSNAAVVSVLIPIMSSLAEDLRVNPLYFILSAAIGVNYAFMLPVSTAPNALVYSYSKGLLKVPEMAISGFVMNLLAVIGAYFVMNTIAVPIFQLNEYPEWAPVKNASFGILENGTGAV